MINVESNGKLYPVRVVEEQLVKRFIKQACECKGCVLARVDFSSNTRFPAMEEEVNMSMTWPLTRIHLMRMPIRLIMKMDFHILFLLMENQDSKIPFGKWVRRGILLID